MTDRRGNDEDNDQFDPYEPGEAAVDPAEASEAGSPGRIAESDPPSSPSLGRWLTNLPVVLGRMFGPVGLAWLVLLLGFFVSMLAFGGVFAVTTPFDQLEDGGAGASPGFVLAMLPVALVLYGANGIAWFGPCRPLRRVAFHGDRAVDSVGQAVGLSLERKWSVGGLMIVLVVGYAFLSGCLSGVFVYGFGASEQGVVGAILIPLVAVASLVPATPALYIVSTTDAGPLESISAGTDLLGAHPGYLLGGLLGVAVVFVVGAVVVPMLLLAGSFVLLVEPVGWLLAVLWMPLGFWVTVVTFATLFATLEEATGRFQG